MDWSLLTAAVLVGIFKATCAAAVLFWAIFIAATLHEISETLKCEQCRTRKDHHHVD